MQRQHTQHGGPSQNAPRIPLALQAVFLSGNRGIVVNNPPPEKAASTTFRGWWRRRNMSIDSGTTKKSTTKSDGAKFPAEKKSATTSKPKKSKVSARRCIHAKIKNWNHLLFAHQSVTFYSYSRCLYRHCPRNNI
jgi:hypothetical protein